MVKFTSKNQNNDAIEKFLAAGGMITVCPPGRAKKLPQRGYVWSKTRLVVNLKNANLHK